MKTNPEQLRALLDEVMPPDAAHCGPGRAAVLRLVRQERRRRVRHRLLLTTAVLILPALLLQRLWHAGPQPAPVPMAQAPMPSPPTARIRAVNDQQLLDLLQDTHTPAALMEWPNGERTLLVWGR